MKAWKLNLDEERSRQMDKYEYKYRNVQIER